MRTLELVLPALCVLLAPVVVMSPLLSESFTVGDATEFQNALNTAAVNGEADTISVMEGSYNITATLTYWSSENYSLLVEGAETDSTVLDGGDSTRIIQFSTTLDRADVELRGMTFRNGNADHGGAIHVETNAASIHIDSCSFEDNTAGYVGGGANIYSIAGEITITRCTFRRNLSPNPSGYPFGTAGGLFVQTEGESTDLRLTDCIFEDNTCERDGAGAMLYPLGSGASITVEDNTFHSNTAEEFGGGCYIRMPGGNSTVRYENNTLTENSTTEAGSGGGTYCEVASGTLTFSKNVYTSNSSIQRGGGVWIEHGSGTLNIRENTFTDNAAFESGGGVSIFTDDGTMTFSRNVLNSNTSEDIGGGLSIATTSGELTVSNNTSYGDSAFEGGSIYFYFDQASAQADVFNNIVWHSSTPAIAMSGAQTTTLRYSDCESGTGEPWFGTGCIDADPLFEDPAHDDFQITWENFPIPDATRSPCIDAGDPASPNDPDGTTSDMGALFFNQSTGIDEDTPDDIAKSFGLYQNYPNPFNPSTTITFDVPNTSGTKQGVELAVYDIRGRVVIRLLNAEYEPGSHRVVWNGRDQHGRAVASGSYLCTLRIRDRTSTRKMVMVK